MNVSQQKKNCQALIDYIENHVSDDMYEHNHIDYLGTRPQCAIGHAISSRLLDGLSAFDNSLRAAADLFFGENSWNNVFSSYEKAAPGTFLVLRRVWTRQQALAALRAHMEAL